MFSMRNFRTFFQGIATSVCLVAAIGAAQAQTARKFGNKSPVVRLCPATCTAVNGHGFKAGSATSVFETKNGWARVSSYLDRKKLVASFGESTPAKPALWVPVSSLAAVAKAKAPAAKPATTQQAPKKAEIKKPRRVSVVDRLARLRNPVLPKFRPDSVVAAVSTAETTPADETVTTEAVAVETPVVETPVVETPKINTQVAESPAASVEVDTQGGAQRALTWEQVQAKIAAQKNGTVTNSAVVKTDTDVDEKADETAKLATEKKAAAKAAALEREAKRAEAKRKREEARLKKIEERKKAAAAAKAERIKERERVAAAAKAKREAARKERNEAARKKRVEERNRIAKAAKAKQIAEENSEKQAAAAKAAAEAKKIADAKKAEEEAAKLAAAETAKKAAADAKAEELAAEAAKTEEGSTTVALGTDGQSVKLPPLVSSTTKAEQPQAAETPKTTSEPVELAAVKAPTKPAPVEPTFSSAKADPISFGKRPKKLTKALLDKRLAKLPGRKSKVKPEIVIAMRHAALGLLNSGECKKIAGGGPSAVPGMFYLTCSEDPGYLRQFPIEEESW